LDFCKKNGIRVGRVPSYSPSSIAEYAISSILALAKNIQKSYELTKEADFTIGGLQCVLIEDKVLL
jgi:D-lactate dehydrogenase